MLNSIQFELWKNCTNNCDFCFNKNSKCSTYHDKIRILNNVVYCLETKNLLKYKRIGLIGGELLDPNQFNSEVYQKFIDTIKFIKTLLKKYNQLEFYITSALEFSDKSILKSVLNIFEPELLSRVFICTSYDTKGRFHNLETLKNFYENMNLLNKTNVNIHVEILPTQDFIEKVLNNEFNPRLFEKEYNCKIDYSDLNSGFFWKNKFEMQKDVPYFFPKRNDFIKFLKKCYTENITTCKEICNYDSFFNELYFLDHDLQLQMILRHGHDEQMPYGHVEKSDYIDSDKLMYDDVNEIWRLLKENY